MTDNLLFFPLAKFNPSPDSALSEWTNAQERCIDLARVRCTWDMRMQAIDRRRIAHDIYIHVMRDQRPHYGN